MKGMLISYLTFHVYHIYLFQMHKRVTFLTFMCWLKRFQELNEILDPGRPPKTDKTVILGDAIRRVTQLRDEAMKLKESAQDLQAKINELKVIVLRVPLSYEMNNSYKLTNRFHVFFLYIKQHL